MEGQLVFFISVSDQILSFQRTEVIN